MRPKMKVSVSVSTSKSWSRPSLVQVQVQVQHLELPEGVLLHPVGLVYLGGGGEGGGLRQ